MSSKLSSSITGVEDLSANLRGLSKELRTEVMALAVKRGARPLESSAKRHAMKSKRTGALRNSIKTKVVKYSKTATAVAIVGPDRDYYLGGKRVRKGMSRKGADKPAKYAHLVEFGHYTRAGTGTSLKLAKGTSRKKGTFVETAFVLAQPFIRPAIKDSAGRVRDEMTAVVDAAVRRYTKS